MNCVCNRLWGRDSHASQIHHSEWNIDLYNDKAVRTQQYYRDGDLQREPVGKIFLQLISFRDFDRIVFNSLNSLTHSLLCRSKEFRGFRWELIPTYIFYLRT